MNKLISISLGLFVFSFSAHAQSIKTSELKSNLPSFVTNVQYSDSSQVGFADGGAHGFSITGKTGNFVNPKCDFWYQDNGDGSGGYSIRIENNVFQDLGHHEPETIEGVSGPLSTVITVEQTSSSMSVAYGSTNFTFVQQNNGFQIVAQSASQKIVCNVN